MSDYASHTVAQLKEQLKNRGLTTDGKKADLIQRLEESDSQQQHSETIEAPIEEQEEVAQQQQEVNEEVQPEIVNETHEEEGEGKTLTVIQPEEEKPEPPKILSPEERKQLAVELLRKKVSRAEKFGDEAAAEAAKKDLIRVEKFGVELGTALAREIGLVDQGLGNGHHNKKRFNHRKNFKKGGFKKFNKKNRN